MGTPVTSAVTTYPSGPNVVAATQMFGEWVVVHDDIGNATGDGTITAPIAYSSTRVHPLIVAQGSLVRFIARYSFGMSAAPGTMPSIRVFGADQIPNSSGVYPSGTIFWRVDANTFTGTSTTVTLATSATAQNDGTTYCYSTPTSHPGDNMHGAKSILVMRDTQMVGGTGVGTVTLLGQVLNI
jgi:hypothetical protein